MRRRERSGEFLKNEKALRNVNVSYVSVATAATAVTELHADDLRATVRWLTITLMECTMNFV
jgi:hypothetical protein